MKVNFASGDGTVRLALPPTTETILQLEVPGRGGKDHSPVDIPQPLPLEQVHILAPTEVGAMPHMAMSEAAHLYLTAVAGRMYRRAAVTKRNMHCAQNVPGGSRYSTSMELRLRNHTWY